MSTDIDKIIKEITERVVARIAEEERNQNNPQAEYYTGYISIGRGSAYDLGPFANEMRKMMAERGNKAIVRQNRSGYMQQSVSFSHHGSAYDYGTKL